jgi:hypothetical protein
VTIEYGARLPRSGVVYMKSADLPVVQVWLEEFSSVTPLELVVRECSELSKGHWVAVATAP